MVNWKAHSEQTRLAQKVHTLMQKKKMFRQLLYGGGKYGTWEENMEERHGSKTGKHATRAEENTVGKHKGETHGKKTHRKNIR